MPELSILFWFFLLMSKYMCLFSMKSLLLGIMLLACSFSVTFMMSTHLLSWYALMFFLVYMGGLLVLFVYTSSLKFKPTFFSKEGSPLLKVLLKMKVMFLLLSIFSQVSWNIHSYSWKSQDKKKFSFNLFKEEEVFFLINVGLLLLLVLWVMSKLSFRSRGALRPRF